MTDSAPTPKPPTLEQALAILEQLKKQTADNVDMLSNANLPPEHRAMFEQLVKNYRTMLETTGKFLDTQTSKSDES